MFVECVKNNGVPYLRLVQGVRVKNKDGYKVTSKKVVFSIGPLSRFDDGQPDYVERLKKSFKAGTPLIPSLLPYCTGENKSPEIYRFSINEGSPDCLVASGIQNFSVMFFWNVFLRNLGLTRFSLPIRD